MANTINIWSKDPSEVGRILSNFTHAPFTLTYKGLFEKFASSEAAWQAMKLLPGYDERKIAAKTYGYPAREWSQVGGKIWYWGEQRYHLGSESSYDLLYHMLLARFTQHKDSRDALLSTGECKFTHNVMITPRGSNTCVPMQKPKHWDYDRMMQIYVDIRTQLRGQL